jgi:uncharacterized protein (TIGR02421 family)
MPDMPTRLEGPAELAPLPELITRVRTELPRRSLQRPSGLHVEEENFYDLLVVDRHLASAAEALRVMRYINPQNSDAVRERYVRTARPPREAPSFAYRPLAFDPAAVRAALASIEIDDTEIGRIYRRKRDEIDTVLAMLAARGSREFLELSRRVHGSPSAADLERGRGWLELPPEKPEQPRLSAAQVRLRLLEACQKLRLPCNVRLSAYLISDAAAGESSVAIRESRHYSHAELRALVCHEIGTHVLRNRNGLRQPFRALFYYGFPRPRAGQASYLQTEEGLAVFTEEMEGVLGTRRRRILAGRVLAVYRMDVEGVGFYDLFQSLVHDHRFERAEAYTICERAFRGGGYTKDHIYLSGYRRVQALWQEDPYRFCLLYAGKVGTADLELVLRLYRQGQGILHPPRFLPAFLQRSLGELRWEDLLGRLHVQVDPAAAL